ncbi:diguanylate phosphodiesterase [Polynucleobacter antarcticus]|uniref:Diguanylate phosphodiesterase n=1 Tax=Polynucleobacter antarcticus TaxID=1743162 RepID=A0A6M9PXM2_9BURK|nr:diguanylate phosphodiesterase [Polynucleobacter antarcticus]QKM63727.1 diguanylate phosphodiesterase [Polynucleobacter antarcticus]
MSPKSRLYTLVKAWKNKPFQEVRDVCGQPWLGISSAALEEYQSWSQRQAISNEPIFNTQGTKLTSSLFRPLLTATDSQVLRLFMEGLDAISYWYRSGRFIPGILPLPEHVMASSSSVDALSDLILNSRLPVGLISLGIQTVEDPDLVNASREGILRMRRLGVLIHLLHFSGTATQMRWIQEIQPEGIHLEMTQFRAGGLPTEIITTSQQCHSQIYASNITLVRDLENAVTLGAKHSYGGLMMPPVSRHQTLHISDSRIAKAIFSLHPHQNQNGDK